MHAIAIADKSAPKARKTRVAIAAEATAGKPSAARGRPRAAVKPGAKRGRPGTPQPLEAALYPDALLKAPTVAALTGLSESSLYRKLAAGEFVQPVRLGKRCTRWKAGAVMAWLEAQRPAP